ncbi:hypothetical protein DEO72_LG10g1532 [Vigna unguiculata]|uniref:Secreted protein n=1 Tax=Vigna unguiculata TaxID=3917 RepID=A0A4D6NC29_VIGUN|nr:hypothetical protein DEO72_LG10g1532 [Vigna unguiculata]
MMERKWRCCVAVVLQEMVAVSSAAAARNAIAGKKTNSRFDGGRWWQNSGELTVEGAAMAEARGRTHDLLQIGGGRRDWHFPA